MKSPDVLSLKSPITLSVNHVQTLLTRRRFLQLAGLVAGSATLSACSTGPSRPVNPESPFESLPSPDVGLDLYDYAPLYDSTTLKPATLPDGRVLTVGSYLENPGVLEGSKIVVVEIPEDIGRVLNLTEDRAVLSVAMLKLKNGNLMPIAGIAPEKIKTQLEDFIQSQQKEIVKIDKRKFINALFEDSRAGVTFASRDIPQGGFFYVQSGGSLIKISPETDFSITAIGLRGKGKQYLLQVKDPTGAIVGNRVVNAQSVPDWIRLNDHDILRHSVDAIYGLQYEPLQKLITDFDEVIAKGIETLKKGEVYESESGKYKFTPIASVERTHTNILVVDVAIDGKSFGPASILASRASGIDYVHGYLLNSAKVGLHGYSDNSPVTAALEGVKYFNNKAVSDPAVKTSLKIAGVSEGRLEAVDGAYLNDIAGVIRNLEDKKIIPTRPPSGILETIKGLFGAANWLSVTAAFRLTLPFGLEGVTDCTGIDCIDDAMALANGHQLELSNAGIDCGQADIDVASLKDKALRSGDPDKRFGFIIKQGGIGKEAGVALRVVQEQFELDGIDISAGNNSEAQILSLNDAQIEIIWPQIPQHDIYDSFEFVAIPIVISGNIPTTLDEYSIQVENWWSRGGTKPTFPMAMVVNPLTPEGKVTRMFMTDLGNGKIYVYMRSGLETIAE